MARNGSLTVIFLLLVVADASNASQFRNLGDLPPKPNSNATVNPPLHSPVSKGNQSKLDPNNGHKPKKDELKDTQVPNNSSKVDPKSLNNTGSVSPPTENCDGLTNRCTDQKKLVACIQGSKEVVLLVHNEGEITLKVNLTIPTSLNFASKELKVPKHQTEKVNISLSIGETTKIVLNAGNGDCVLHLGSVPEGSFFSRLPSYSKVVTPIYGAYFLVVTTLIVGGSWACCKYRKRRQLGEVPYQELEMGMQESNPAINAETAEGWDEGWDDDWDDNKAVKSPGGKRIGNISGNGLTSRSSNRDGWEVDWDD